MQLKTKITHKLTFVPRFLNTWGQIIELYQQNVFIRQGHIYTQVGASDLQVNKVVLLSEIIHRKHRYSDCYYAVNIYSWH